MSSSPEPQGLSRAIYMLDVFCYHFFQIPRYIITLHELLAHTPHDHVERNSLEYAKSKLEELSKVCKSAGSPLIKYPHSVNVRKFEYTEGR